MTRSKPDIPDIDDMAFCTCATLRKATRAVTQLYDAALKPSGIRVTQFNLLAALANLGPVPQSRLAEVLVMDRTTLIRNLAPLERDGLISTETDGANGVKTIALTQKGSRLHDDALPRWREAQARMVDALGDERWADLIAGLQASIGAAHAD